MLKDDYGNFSLYEDGLTILRIPELFPKILLVKNQFEKLVVNRFGSDGELNRILIKRFVDSPVVAKIFSNNSLLSQLINESEIKQPVYCGPTVSHYTDTGETGKSYGLPMHIDFPSMASSTKSVICWFALSDCTNETHGLEFIPCLHKNGVLEGEQMPNGYVLDSKYQNSEKRKILNIKFGDIVLFTSFTPHATHVNKSFDKSKMSISKRFDCFLDQEWINARLPNAYGTSVDRALGKKRSKVINSIFNK
jgi:hypothetical protein